MHTVKTSLKRATAVAGLATIGVMLGAPVAASAAPSVYECRPCGGGISSASKVIEAPAQQNDNGPGVGQIAGAGSTLALAAVGGTLLLRNRRRRNAAE